MEFIVADASSLDASWTSRFQLVLMFDSCREMPRPDLAIAEAHRCLDSGGMLAMVEVWKFFGYFLK
jgi:ubiquinone/menaquinone biosynthesis C-methylase UbiE